MFARLFAARTWLLAPVHALLFAAVYWASFALRFDLPLPAEWRRVFVLTLPAVLFIKVPVFAASGQFHGWWRYVTFGDLVALLRAAAVSTLAIVAAGYFASSTPIPRSVVIVDCILTVVMLGSFRSTMRMLREHFLPSFKPEDFSWALLVGTDEDSRVLAHQIQSQSQLPYRIRGFLSTNGAHRGMPLGGIPVLGRVEQVREIASAYQAADVLVPAGALAGKDFRWLVDACNEAGVNLKIIRGLEDRLNGDHHIPIRSIEINDLLRRDPVQLDTDAIARLIEGRTVVVTGAGGSIGSEICRQVLRFNPQSLVLFGRGENRLFFLERELRALRTSTVFEVRIGSVTDVDRVRQVFDEQRPDILFHAAAHKHVPLMEANVCEAIKNNVLGTKTVADLADELGVGSFVLISTDKAVHPTSVMGASKHLAERYVHALSQVSSTRFVVTRFGNVLGSAGSVVPIFQEQIRNGGPITVTDPRMTRFFMTIPEASQLVLQAAAMGYGGEIFVLDMGEPVRIVDLARDLIRLSGLPEEAIEIAFTGIRPGEKLFEELYFSEEQTLPTPNPHLRVAKHRQHSLTEVRESISQLAELVNSDAGSIRAKLRAIIAEYQPQVESAAAEGAAAVYASPEHPDEKALTIH